MLLIQIAVVNSRLVDPPLEGPFQPAARADQQGLLHARLLVHQVEQDFLLNLDAVHVKLNAGGETRAVVSHRDVAPLAQRNLLHGLRSQAVVEPTRNHAELQLAVDQVEAIAAVAAVLAVARFALGARDDGAVLGVGPNPSRRREAVLVAELRDVAEVHIALAVEFPAPAHAPFAVRGFPAVEFQALAVERDVRDEIARRLPAFVARARDFLLPLRLRLHNLGSQPLEVRFGAFQARIQLAQALFLLVRRRRNHRRRVAVFEHPAALRNVVEISENLIELALRNRVEFVIVAARAAHRQPQPHGRRRIDAVHHILHQILFRNDAALAVGAMVAIEPGGDDLVLRRMRQQVAGELLHGEPVERLVRIECVDDPVAPAPLNARRIGLVSVGIGVARRVEPANRHALSIPRRAEQPVDESLVCVGRLVAYKRVDLFRRRRNTRQVERDPANQRRAVGFGRRRQAFFVEPRQHKSVDGIRPPSRPRNFGQRRLFRRDERPVPLVLPAFADPPLQRLDLVRRKLLLGVGRRHAPSRIFCGNALIDFAVVEVAGDDPMTPAQVGRRAFRRVEPQAAQPVFRIRPVALVTLVRQNRPNIAVELDFSGCGESRRQQGGQQRQRDMVTHTNNGAFARSCYHLRPCGASPQRLYSATPATRYPWI